MIQIALNNLPVETFSGPGFGLVIDAGDDPEEKILSIVCSVMSQSYQNWRLSLVCGKKRVLSMQDHFNRDDRIKWVDYDDQKEEKIQILNKTLVSMPGEFVLLLNRLELVPSALIELSKLVSQIPDIDLIYSDGERISSDGEESDSTYKPAWSPDYLFSYNYIGPFLLIKKSLFKQLGGFKPGYEGSEVYEFLLRAADRNRKIAHIPAVLYREGKKNQPVTAIASQRRAITDTLNRRGIRATVLDTSWSGIFRVKYQITDDKKVSIIIPTKDKAEVLEKCIDSILKKTTYKNYEILVVNNRSSEQKTLDYLKSLGTNPRIKILNDDQPFNYSRINNFAAARSRGYYLLFLNNDTEVISGEWLSAMIEFGQRKETGVVGARLLYPDHTIQHAGVVMEKGGRVLGHFQIGSPGESPGYEARLVTVQNFSAVTGACMLIRRKLFEEMRGFDENFTVYYNDVELCIRIKAKGYKIVYTPYAELYHHESVSINSESIPEKLNFQSKIQREHEMFIKKWGHMFVEGDPFFSPNLKQGVEMKSVKKPGLSDVPGVGRKSLRKRILLGNLASIGDCLYATAIARQIKRDYPGCHLTWAIGSMCRDVITGNPYVDEVWEIPMKKREEMGEAWYRFEGEARKKQEEGQFDEIFMTQLCPANFQNYDGLVRSSLFRGYPKPITVPVAPVIQLSAREIENVRLFADFHQLEGKSPVILFESSPKSQQSFVTPEFAIETAKKLLNKFPHVKMILSSNHAFVSPDPRIIDGSVLSFRENAELTKYCSLLIGCSSGITWLSTSDWAKPLPMIQLLNKELWPFGSVMQDFKNFGISTEFLIEMLDCSPDRLIDCIEMVLSKGFGVAKERFQEEFPFAFNHYATLLTGLLAQGAYSKGYQMLSLHFQRYSHSLELILYSFAALKSIFHREKLRLKNQQDPMQEQIKQRERGAEIGSEMLLKSAYKCLQAGKGAEAQRLFREVLVREPENVQALHFLGMSCYQLGQKESAAEYFLKALILHPGDPVVYNNLGVIFAELGRPEEGKECYELALSLKSEYGEAWFNLGTLLKAHNRNKDAMNCLRNALNFSPNDTEARKTLEELIKLESEGIPGAEENAQFFVCLPGGTPFNRILDNQAREQYQPAIRQLFHLVPDMMARKIPEANVQQAFVLDTVRRFASKINQPKMLCVGCYEDSASASLKKLGYRIEEIDPVLNYDLNDFFNKPSTRKGSYDIVFSTSVLEHVKDDERFMTQVADLLAPGGMAILTCDYNDQYRPGDRMPQEDCRLYTQADLKFRLMPLLNGCELIDTPQWNCAQPDFSYAGCQYTFATWVFRKGAQR